MLTRFGAAKINITVLCKPFTNNHIVKPKRGQTQVKGNILFHYRTMMKILKRAYEVLKRS